MSSSTTLRISLCLMLTMVIASAAASQTQGVHRGLFISGGNLGTGLNWMLQLDTGNRPTTLRTDNTSPLAPWQTWGNVYGMTLDADNATVIVPGIVGTTVNPLIYALMRYDPVQKAVVGTLWQGPAGPSSFVNASNFTLDSDGNVITIDNGCKPHVIAKYDVFSGVWQHFPLPVDRYWPGLGVAAGVGGCEWDAFEGGVHHATWNGGMVLPPRLHKTSPDLSATTIVSSGFSTYEIRYGGTLLDNGDWVSTGYNPKSPQMSLYFLGRRGEAKWKFRTVGTWTTPWDVTHEKYAAPGQGVWVANCFPLEVRYLDVTANTIATVFTGTTTTMPGLPYEIIPLHDRDIGSRRTGRRTWNLHINPGAGSFSGKPYIVAASLARARPGIKLADGREIYIGFDALTAVTATQPLPPLLIGNIGNLDPRGRAVARIDLTTMGRAANGTVVHFCGVVLDAAAPGGVAWVLDPHAFVVNVM